VELSKELETIKTIARMAASICQSIQYELVPTAGDNDHAEKSGHEPVTIADYASQALIGHALAGNFSDDAVIAEERSEEYLLLLTDRQRMYVQQFVTDALGGYVFEEDICAWLDFGKRKKARRTWVIDPIDGTKGFLSHRHYCVAVGLLIEGEPVLGVLASPGFFSDEADGPEDVGALTYASQGNGAYMEPLGGGESVPLRISAINNPQQATLLTSFEPDHSNLDFIRQVEHRLERTPASPRRRVDSQDKYAMAAAGMGDIYLRLPPDPSFREKIWDHAAGFAIVTEAGGRASDIYGQELDFSAGTRMVDNRGVVVTNGYLHAEVLAAIASSEF
jgi:3'(2'), 5'-bisphosphate nucleotidase